MVMIGPTEAPIEDIAMSDYKEIPEGWEVELINANSLSDTERDNLALEISNATRTEGETLSFVNPKEARRIIGYKQADIGDDENLSRDKAVYLARVARPASENDLATINDSIKENAAFLIIHRHRGNQADGSKDVQVVSTVYVSPSYRHAFLKEKGIHNFNVGLMLWENVLARYSTSTMYFDTVNARMARYAEFGGFQECTDQGLINGISLEDFKTHPVKFLKGMLRSNHGEYKSYVRYPDKSPTVESQGRATYPF